MPPTNSPQELSDNPSDLTVPFTLGTRLPIVRTSDNGGEQRSNLRALLERAIDQVANPANHRLAQVDPSTQGEIPEGTQSFTNALRQDMRDSIMSTYRGWAPGTSDLDHTPAGNVSRRTTSRIGESHQSQLSRSTATRRYLRELERNQSGQENIAPGTPAHVPNASQRAWQAAQQRRTWDSANTPSRSPSNSLRTTALLESVRRQARLEALRERIHNFTDARAQEHYLEQMDILDEYAHLLNEYGSNGRRETAVSTDDEPLKVTLDEHRTTKLLQEMIKSMDEVRKRLSPIEALSLRAVPPPSSWLRPGATFTGHQKANAAVSLNARLRQNSRRQQLWERSMHQEPMMTSRPSATSRTNQAMSSATSTTTQEHNEDWWPVKVSITSVDHKTMTLTGSMEAFNVSKTKGVPAGQDSAVSNITTYLEGEIIDFHKHTLKTTNFKAGSIVDAAYWRRLEPFKSLDDTEIVDGLRDANWLREHLSPDWILMRWKEKCFITSSDSNSALTISGFYYISLRRSDGMVDGLYHDPSACPYQRLNLTPERSAFPLHDIVKAYSGIPIWPSI